MNWFWNRTQPDPPPVPRDLGSGVRDALRRAQEIEPVRYPIRPPQIMPGVVPVGATAQVAMDSAAYEQARMAHDSVPTFSAAMYNYGNIEGFPGYPYLMLLALRVEYLNMADAYATDMTREWIKFNSSETAGDETKERITELEQAVSNLQLRHIIAKAVRDDCFYGTGQVLINIRGAKPEDPLIISRKTITKGSLESFKNVDPIWTTPLMYNALDPSKPDFYKPTSWWVMGQHWDATRMEFLITRPVPDIYKPAFNFSGISLSQLAEPYVNNWLRTRQSVSDLINNFSIIVLKTDMDQVLSGGSDGSSLFDRIKLFTMTRSNKGVMALDNVREALEQVAVPLGGLHELQAQAQEQMCSATREPAVKMTGIAPSGFGNVGEGEIRVWYDLIHALQEMHLRKMLERMIKIVQVSLWGEIDEDISFEFNPLYQMSDSELAIIRMNDSIRAGNLIDRGVIDPQEERERMARDPESGYSGIDIEKEIPLPSEAEEQSPLGRGTR